MGRLEHQRPTHNLTQVECLFMNVIENGKYKDQGSLRVNLIKLKSKYFQ